MNKCEYTFSTQVIGTEDGRATYEVRKTLSLSEGKRVVVIGLYPTVSLLSPYIMDYSTLFLTNRAQELGYNDFRIVNIYSKVCKGKLSSKQLVNDDENITYLEKVFEEEKDNDTDIIIAWGSSLKLNETTKNMKIQILKMLKKIINDNKIKQLTSSDLDTETLLNPHILWMGLHCKETWYTEKVSVEHLLSILGVTVETCETKKKRSKKKIESSDLCEEKISQ